jgi:ATP-dependent Clp protease ATP-binding subunit ClpC
MAVHGQLLLCLAHALTSSEIFQIVDLMVARVNEQVRQQGMELEITVEAKEVLAKEGFDPTYGARPLRRAVQRMIEDPLAEQMLMSTFKEGDIIKAVVKDGDIVFEKSEKAEEEDATPPADRGACGRQLAPTHCPRDSVEESRGF